MTKEDAVKINKLVDNIVAISNQVLEIANNSGDKDSQERVQRALALTVTELGLEILEPIYLAYPELRPPEMKEIQA